VRKTQRFVRTIRKIESVKAQIRTKINESIRGIKRQFGYEEIRFRDVVSDAFCSDRWPDKSKRIDLVFTCVGLKC